MNIEYLRRELSPSEKPGLDITDPRLVDIATLAQNGEYMAAAVAVEGVFEEGIYDVRLMGFFLYGLFLEGGVRGLKEVFSALSFFLETNWNYTGPEKKREKHGQVGLGWFFNQLLKKLQHEEASKGGIWQQWLQETHSDDAGDALEAASDLRRVMSQVLEDAAEPLLDGLLKISDWLRAFQRLVYSEEAVAEETPEETEASEEEKQEKTAASGGAGSRTPCGEGLLVEGSVHLELLMKKLQIFEQLMEREMYPRAALVADDIMQTIENFDPRLYFPKLFSRFFMLLALRSEDVMQFEEMKESPEWQAMREFFKVDPDAFVDF
ncbi:hypothetical protein LZ24_02897 [Desulfobotulus alkaliphilus]|uniref:ImpA N-terminal domain-containing protein n=1 Tax=Desulfobotulus alkaliphilus TaxID=622671 RepID=A0A562RDQ2_9BACT|nr:type VI secretion system protein IglI family protein [Desulfobotulus alkaliphilus]TWI66674.1 hypothetical protein LZ24_02897 [Desulfobotulus alkaliphilus]